MTKLTVPASFFSMVLGIVGLGSAWRAASKAWEIAAWPAEVLMVLGAGVWSFLLIAYGAKWVFNRPEALAEIRHPVQCCFVSLVPACTTLMGLVAAPDRRDIALACWITGSLGQLLFVAFRAAGLWRGGLSVELVTPILYLPTVAANLISSIVAGALGLHSWGAIFLGMGFFSWIAIESVLVMRLWTAASLNLPLRPSLGIHMAPPVVASVAYLSNTSGPPDFFVVGMWGYGLLQLLFLLRLLPWVREQEFSASYWGYSFGATAVSVAAIQMAVRDPHSAMALLSLPLFLFSNAVIALLVIATLVRLAQRRLLPPGLIQDAAGQRKQGPTLLESRRKDATDPHIAKLASKPKRGFPGAS